MKKERRWTRGSIRAGGRRLVTGSMTTAVLLSVASTVSAQSRSIFVVGGYGTTTYEAAATSSFPNDFSATVAPVILYTMGQDVLFETELEFGLTGANTTTALEYAQIDYLGFESVQIIAGKFLLPFGVFGERLHPTWINKLPTGPVLYGHAHGGVAEEGLLPVMSDAGAMVRWTAPVGSRLRLDISAFVTQGPRLGEEEAEHDDGEEEHDPTEPDDDHAPPVAFGVAFGDNNRDKMVGGRIGLATGSYGVYVSGFRGDYDDSGVLDYKAAAVSADWRTGGYELRGEYVLTRQEFVVDGALTELRRSGYYAQISRRMGSWEPVVRWGDLADGRVEDETTIEGHHEIAIGLDYWLRPTIPVKVAYEIHQDRDDRIYVQWAYGF